MSVSRTALGRNQSMECCKLLASIFVMFIHVPFPGKLGGMVTCLGRFAVPVFFAISGYFSYQTPHQKLAKRVKRIFFLNLWAIAVCLAWGCVYTFFDGGEPLYYLLEKLRPRADDLVAWMLLQVNPFSGHLWYLAAIFLCYAALWGYVRFFGEKPVNYTPLYLAGFLLIIPHIVMGELGSMTGISVSFELYRNFLFFGLPMFTLGLFLGQYQEQILKNFSLTWAKLVLLIALGALVSLLQWYAIGTGELPVGMLLLVPALMLLMVQYPVLTRRAVLCRIIDLFGGVSTAVYILHLVVLDAYNSCLGWRFQWLSVPRQELLATAFVTVTTLAVCFAWQLGRSALKARLGKKR